MPHGESPLDLDNKHRRLSGSQRTLLSPSPLRTGRTSYQVSGSSKLRTSLCFGCCFSFSVLVSDLLMAVKMNESVVPIRFRAVFTLWLDVVFVEVFVVEQGLSTNWTLEI